MPCGSRKIPINMIAERGKVKTGFSATINFTGDICVKAPLTG